jgi:hypothetical protein
VDIHSNTHLVIDTIIPKRYTFLCLPTPNLDHSPPRRRQIVPLSPFRRPRPAPSILNLSRPNNPFVFRFFRTLFRATRISLKTLDLTQFLTPAFSVGCAYISWKSFHLCTLRIAYPGCGVSLQFAAPAFAFLLATMTTATTSSIVRDPLLVLIVM